MSLRRNEVKGPRIAKFDIVEESLLPLPWVHYPGSYGVFHAFSQDKGSHPFLCSCSIPLIRNYIDLRTMDDSIYSDPLHATTLRLGHFPRFVTEMSTISAFQFERDLSFRDQLCHRCNQTTPSLLYCAEMYGTTFVQYYGWYIEQAYMRCGIDSHTFVALNICSDRLAANIQRFKDLLRERARGAPEDDWEKRKYNARWPRNREIRQAKRDITRFVEDEARADFGFKSVGEGWVSESILAGIVHRQYEGKELIRHHRPNWLEGLELDIYLPELKLAYEYQGQQHFYPIEHWGGSEACEKLKERDKLKNELCEKMGVTLVHISFRDPLTEEFVVMRTTQATEAGLSSATAAASPALRPSRCHWLLPAE